MFVMGLDIGYSNLKVVCGDSQDNQPKSFVLPVGAGPQEYLPQDVLGPRVKSGYFVKVNGETYVAGVEPSVFADVGWIRELHEDYAFTKTYKALFHSALLLAETNTIDLLITGLPTSQYLNENFKTRIEKSLIGEHQITKKLSVNVKDVKVIGQPIGAFVNTLMKNKDEDLIESILNQFVMVFDVGFFSVDWVLIKNRSLLKEFSGSTTLATSKLLEKASRLIASDYGKEPGVDELESLVRQGKEYVWLSSKKIKILPYIEEASKTISDIVVREVKQSVRSKNVDIIILTGGGSSFYYHILQKGFPKAQILTSLHNVLDNAEGFWRYGVNILEG